MPNAHHRVSLFQEFTGLSVMKAALLLVPIVGLFVFSIWIAFHFLDPMPPRRIVLAAGPEGGPLHSLALRYAEQIGGQGISVDVRITRGTADNLELLADRASPVHAGFVMAGMASKDRAAQLVNVSNLGHAPLWCLARMAPGDVTLAQLKGKRLVVGAPGTGLNAWLAPLLAANGITAENSQLLHLTPGQSVQALADGGVDVIFLNDAATDPNFQRALGLPGVHLMSFPRAEAYERRFGHLVRLTLPPGTLDLERGIPERDLSLIGTTWLIAARADVHPTVVDLLVDAARELNANRGLFEKRGEYPNLVRVDELPISAQAILYARDGPSLLRRYLPLWAADALQRMLILAVPLLAVAVPLVRFVPSLLDLLARRHLFLGYAALRRADRAFKARAPGSAVEDLLTELDRIEESVYRTKESVFRAGELYTFRGHLSVVRDAVLARARHRSQESKVQPAAAPGA